MVYSIHVYSISYMRRTAVAGVVPVVLPAQIVAIPATTKCIHTTNVAQVQDKAIHEWQGKRHHSVSLSSDCI